MTTGRFWREAVSRKFTDLVGEKDATPVPPFRTMIPPNRAATPLRLLGRNLESRAMNTRPGETSSWFRENEASLEAAATAYDRGNECQAAADLLHDAVDNGEPKAATRADRTSTNEGLLQSFESL
jgi:hypothetical protein